MAIITVAVTGTRFGMTELQDCLLEGLLSFGNFPKGCVFRHGSCRGVDVQAARLVRKLWDPAQVRIISHPGPDSDPNRADSGVDDEVLPGKTHFARNRDLVKALTRPDDKLIALPVAVVPRAEWAKQWGGTWYTINYALKQGKRLTIIWPDGGLE